jgi:hypothetical protein
MASPGNSRAFQHWFSRTWWTCCGSERSSRRPWCDWPNHSSPSCSPYGRIWKLLWQSSDSNKIIVAMLDGPFLNCWPKQFLWHSCHLILWWHQDETIGSAVYRGRIQSEELIAIQSSGPGFLAGNFQYFWIICNIGIPQTRSSLPIKLTSSQRWLGQYKKIIRKENVANNAS